VALALRAQALADTALVALLALLVVWCALVARELYSKRGASVR
jgi:hypothetical protein